MQVSTKWLKDYIDIDLSADELAEKFTLAGIPVENVIHAGEGLEKVVTGRIEPLHTLDDTNRLAKGGELVIADAEKAAGLAGIMGGFESAITEATTTVILEAASFNSASIRRTN